MKFILIKATWVVVPLVILAFIPLAKAETPMTPSPEYSVVPPPQGAVVPTRVSIVSPPKACA